MTHPAPQLLAGLFVGLSLTSLLVVITLWMVGVGSGFWARVLVEAFAFGLVSSMLAAVLAHVAKASGWLRRLSAIVAAIHLLIVAAIGLLVAVEGMPPMS